MKLSQSEPVITVGSIGAIAAAVLALIVAFGVDLTDEQQTAILGVVAVAAPIIVAIVTRRLVTPNSKVASRTDDN